jgi:glycosyltransferase involved in cell wall biosynthesis
LRLLVLAPSYPYPVRDGTQLRVHHLFRRLPADVELDLLCFDGDCGRPRELPGPLRGSVHLLPYPERPVGLAASQWRQLFRRDPSMLWKFRSREMAEMTASLSRQAGAVLAVGLQMGQYLHRVEPGRPRLLDNYNVEWLILDRMADTRPPSRRWFWKLEARKLRRAERELIRAADVTIAISPVDRDGMLLLAPEASIVVVPNGVDVGYHGAIRPRPAGQPPVFVIVGSFNWHVNEDAAVWFCGQAWPLVRRELPEARLLLVGKDPSEPVRALGSLPGVTVTGTVEDVRPFVEQATAALSPLRYGSGIRNKILESFAAGRPVVTTTVGCEGIPVEHGRHLLIADDAPGFAAACVRLAREPDVAARLAAAARALACEEEAHATRQFDAVLRGALAGAEGPISPPES